jgi:hypothetical protein
MQCFQDTLIHQELKVNILPLAVTKAVHLLEQEKAGFMVMQ